MPNLFMRRAFSRLFPGLPVEERIHSVMVNGPQRITTLKGLSFPVAATLATLAATALTPASAAPSNGLVHNGYHIDVSSIEPQDNLAAIKQALFNQLDIVEGVGFESHVLEFFRMIPIVVQQGACAQFHSVPACYTRGGVMVRPIALDAERPVILHEMLHAYHDHLIPQGTENPEILSYFNRAKNNQLYAANGYLLSNQREFFATTASIFLYGKAAGEPYTRETLKEKQPRYFAFLVRLFGFDPSHTNQRAPQACWQPGLARNSGIAEPSCNRPIPDK
jgi:hypothetical protein